MSKKLRLPQPEGDENSLFVLSSDEDDTPRGDSLVESGVDSAPSVFRGGSADAVEHVEDAVDDEGMNNAGAASEDMLLEDAPWRGDYNVFRKIGIVDVDFPRTRLDHGRKMQIGANLLCLLVRLAAEGKGFPLKIMDASLRDSGIIVACYNNESLRFLQGNLGNICPTAVTSGRKKDCRLRVIEVNRRNESVRPTGHIYTYYWNQGRGANRYDPGG